VPTKNLNVSKQENVIVKNQEGISDIFSETNNRLSIILAYILFFSVFAVTLATYVNDLSYFKEVLPGSAIVCAVALFRINELKSIKKIKSNEAS